MIPLKDDNPTRTFSFVTVLLIAANVALFLWEVLLPAGARDELILKLAVIPFEITHLEPGEADLVLYNGMTLLTAMFLHGGVLHLAGNMIYLWIFGNNIEDSMGHARFVVFYLACGVAAALLQVVFNPGSGIPMVGASGAISGVMGAYLILYPRVKVFAMVPIGFMLTSIALPAWTMLLYWAAIQFVSGLTGLLAAEERGGVAFWAHIGGFVAGVVLIKLFARRDDVAAHRGGHWEPRRVAGR